MENKIIQVVRYIRPRACVEDKWGSGIKCPEEGLHPNLYGITLVFHMCYDTGQVQVRWSVCNGDNFSRGEGVYWALYREEDTYLQYPLDQVESCGGLVASAIHALKSVYEKVGREFPEVETGYSAKSKLFEDALRAKQWASEADIIKLED